MCGFLGQFSEKKINFEVNDIAIKKLISHRGPDSFKSVVFNENIFGAFARLSITDLSDNSNQPMTSPCGNYDLMFNGEIYNFLELKENLISQNWNFSSNGDTEVLLAGLVIFGESFIEKLDGIFAFAFINKKDNSIILCRDRMGIKPLYFSILDIKNNSSLVFGSEIKFLTQYFLSKPILNHDVLLQYFKYKYVIGEDTLVKNVKSIEPGCYIKFYKNKIKSPVKRIFFDISEIEPIKTKTDIQQKIHKTLKKSVYDQFQSDANIGLQISGGVDSTIIAGMASEMAISPHDCFFVSMKNSIHDESKYAQLVSENFNFPLNIITLTEKNYFDSIKTVANFHDTPINHPHSAAIYLLSKLASSKVKVLVSGEGADELCFGYLRYDKDKILDDNDILNNYSFLRKENELNKLNKLINTSKFIDADTARKDLISKLPNYGALNKLRLYELKTHLQDLLLRLDRMLMANSIEGRVPFLSNDFVKLCLSIDGKSFYNIQSGKFPLKKIADHYMGSGFSSRDKVGFMIPLNEWAGTKEYKNDLVKMLDIADISFINSDVVFNIYNELLNQESIDSNMKFYSLFTNLNRWMKQHSMNWS